MTIPIIPEMRKKRGLLFCLCALSCVAVLGLIPVQSAVPAENSPQDSRRGGQRARPQPSSVKIGEFAPEFELPFLTFETNSEGDPVGVIDGESTFKLSDFRGRKPVCLIMSSYT
jgi:hypothetical protein